LKPKNSYIKIFLKSVPMQFKSAPWHTTADCLLGIIHAIFFAVTVIATQGLFDAISDAAAGIAGFWECLVPLLILAGVTFGQQIMNGLHNFHSIAVLMNKSKGWYTTQLHRKLQRIDPACFEDTDFLDDLNKAKEGVNAIIFFCMILFILFCFYGVYFATVGAYLFSLKPILLYTLLLAFLPAALSQTIRVKIFTKLEEQNAPLRRENEYYQKTLCDREYFKETRILGAYKFLHGLFSDTMMLLTRKMWQAERKTALIQLLLNFITFSGMAAASYMLFTATMAGEITVGAFAAVFAALSLIFGIMQEIINHHIGNMNKDVGKVANLIKMLEMPEREHLKGIPDFSLGVSAENVSYTYPGREEPAVNDLSLAIADGETIAIVGENGAGKSTLVRLLTGIYRPSCGKVSIGGMEYACSQDTTDNKRTKIHADGARKKSEAHADYTSAYRGISGVFQKYQRYKMTLGENVSISDTTGANSAVTASSADGTVTSDSANSAVTASSADTAGSANSAVSARVHSALHDAGAEIDAGLDVMLSPEFDGIDLSGGQWQRLAIARGLYRVNGFIVLDEPTSAIDPIEETRIYTQFQRLAEGKCAVIVTHRLGSAKLANRIVVMDAGRIIDMGTHDELLSRQGKYAEMWAAQAKWYERE